MKRLVLALVVLLSAQLWAVNGNMGNGDGSADNPYLIEDLADFDAFAANSAYWAAGVHTKLMTDIDLSGRTYTAAVIAPERIAPFMGVFNGSGFTISNVLVNAPTKDQVGLFGWVDSNGQITNLGVVDIDIQGRYVVGGLAGRNGGTVSSCFVTGVVIGGYTVGGLVGYNVGSFGTITACYVAGAVSGTGHHVGGLVGSNGGTVSSCFVTGVVIGGSTVGGLVGNNEASPSTITACYVAGAVSSTGHRVGGLVGDNRGIISSCYVSGAVSSTGNDVGGLVGIIEAHGTVSSSFWDVETSGQQTSAGGTGLTTLEMMTLATFTGAGWDFSEEDGGWMMLREGEDYPRLAWQQIFGGDIAGLYGVNIVDFAYLARYWGLTDCNGADDCGRADIDGSGDVGLGDLVYVAEDWLKGR